MGSWPRATEGGSAYLPDPAERSSPQNAKVHLFFPVELRLTSHPAKVQLISPCNRFLAHSAANNCTFAG
jgi:hypothetical protein